MVDAAEAFASAVRAELRDAREQADLSFEDLGSRAGILRGSLFRYLNGNGSLPIQALFRICTALAVTPATLMLRAEVRAAMSATRRSAPPLDASVTVRELGRRISLLANVLSNGTGATTLHDALPSDVHLDRVGWFALVEGRAKAVPDADVLGRIADAAGVPRSYLTESAGSDDVASTDARLEFIRSMQTADPSDANPHAKITPAMLRVMTEPVEPTG